ncbi:MAG: hypothetical protein JWM74_1797 [Myxococcaceae bacterium]|nr:hypothetical protein [Myxococcaceae bacterium]
MKAITGTKSELLALAAKVDAEMGMPIAGVDVGEGIHAPPEQSLTVRYADLREHPTTKGEFVYPLDEKNRGVVAEKQVEDGELADPKAATLAGEVELGADWKVGDETTVKSAPVKSADATDATAPPTKEP